ncbi:hypothetical protein A2U01_0102921, partial [Trifolium medium]|nr:hypothetical protein [Trifolium medium]
MLHISNKAAPNVNAAPNVELKHRMEKSEKPCVSHWLGPNNSPPPAKG